MRNKKYIVRCPACKFRIFDAYYVDAEVKCSICDTVFEVKLEKKGGIKVNRSGTEPQRDLSWTNL